MSNLESQENELLCLQSIYEKKEFIVDCMDPPSGRIVAEVRLTEEFFIKVAVEEKFSATDPKNLEEGFSVAYLPPINIFFKFPETYPQQTCPAFLLSCNWLTLEQLSALCKQLEALWETNKDAILYTWIQFLQDEALDFLNISQFLDITDLLKFKIRDNFRNLSVNDSEDQNNVNGNPAESCKPMNLGQLLQVVPSISGGDGEIDLRAFNELSDGKMLIQLLKDYNSCKMEDIFYKNYQECNVCLLSKQGSEFMIFKDCMHFFCRDCVKEYFESQIKDGNVNSLKCLQGECQTTSDGSTVKKLVSSDLYERYDRILLSTTLEGMSDIAYCPRKDCQCACIIDTCGRMGTCSACGFVFCPFCKMTYHGVAPCNFKTAQRKNIFDEYVNGSTAIKEGLEKRFGKRVIKSLVEETLSESWKDSNSKSCPHCRASIEKTEGCNKMTCFRCGSYFCWLCMKMLTSSNPYSHYSDRTSKCYNLLFPEDYLLNDDFDVEPGDILDDFEFV